MLIYSTTSKHGTVNMQQDPDIIRQVIRHRRSINRFRQDPVPLEVIRDAIDAAVWAPNHRMTEPWRFYLLGEETWRRVCALNAEIVTAAKGEKAGQLKLKKWMQIPGCLVVTCEESGDPLQRQEDYAACACAIQNLSLLLWSQGVGMKWTTGDVTRDDRFYDHIWVNRNEEFVVGLLWYGYPDEEPVSARQPGQQFTVELP